MTVAIRETHAYLPVARAEIRRPTLCRGLWMIGAESAAGAGGWSRVWLGMEVLQDAASHHR